MTQLYEKYRPATFAEVVGQAKAVTMLDGVRERCGTLAGSAYWVSGPSGVGKTTIARLIAAEVADSYNVEEIDASELSAERITSIAREQRSYALGQRRGRAYIVNEAHGLSNERIRRLLTILEPIPSHVVWIFTTTKAGESKLFGDCDDASPLLSRCKVVPMAQRDLCRPFAERLRTIAQAEGLDGQPVEAYERLLKECRNNFRAAFQAVESGIMKK